MRSLLGVRRWRVILAVFMVCALWLLPGGGSTASAAGGTRYVVRRGDSLAAIASAHGTSVAAIMQANGLSDPDFIWYGQVLLIPGAGSAPAVPARSAPGRHMVQWGETLSKIAQRYGLSQAALMQANGIANPDRVYAGQSLIIPAKGETAPAEPSGGSRFVVSISQQHCWVYRGQTVLYSWPCSTGRAGAPTKPGTFQVQSKMGRAYGAAWNFWMPYWLGIYWAGSTENGIHGLPYSAASGAKVWASSVGTPVTYGCVLLSDDAAKTLYDLAYIGMPVTIQR
jgi:LysM repeat protein